MTRKEIRKELVESYAEGRMTRRAFLRKLTATGVSVGAALTYASVIGAEKAFAQTIPNGEFYPDREPLPEEDHYPVDVQSTSGGEWSGTTTEEHEHWHGGRRARRHHHNRHKARHRHKHLHPVTNGIIEGHE
ncbi:MAG: twin-arginine translocation signal domain-containing protein [Actinomycetota bacterium]